MASGPLDAATRHDLRRVQAGVIASCRAMPAVFCEYVLRDERTGKRIALAPYHVEWHRLISDHDRLILWGHVESGKTQQVSVGRTLWELGTDPSARIVLVSNTQGQAMKSLRSISTYIERSEKLRSVFPGLRPALPWTQSQITVERDTFSKDPSVQAIGVHGQIIGSRIDRLIVDDILDWENTRTPQQREDLSYWFHSEIVGRLTADARVTIVGNPYTVDDLLHVLEKGGVYTGKRYAVLNEKGASNWPTQWPPQRIARVTEELGGLGHPEVARQLYCQGRTDESSRCQLSWVQRCLERGEGIEPLDGLDLDELAETGAEPSIGVDIGVGTGAKAKRAAKTVVFVVLNFPGGEKQVARVRSGRWLSPQIVAETEDAVARFHGRAWVETNGAQAFILQGLHGKWSGEVGDKGLEAEVFPFQTGGNKTHPTIGVESVFAELARGLWIIPSVRDKDDKLIGATPEIREWLQEMLSYTPDRHTGDHLMASWIAKEGQRKSGSREVGARIIGDDVADSDVLASARHPGRGRGIADKLRGWEAILRADRR